jgi:hypothetical protein
VYQWIVLKKPEDLASLEKFVGAEYEPTKVAKKLIEGMSHAVKAVLIESRYVDKDYRSTYYHFYSKKGHHYSSHCVRLHFFDSTVSFEQNGLKLSCEDGKLEHHYFGYMVLRPTGITTIGRSVVSPDVRTGLSGGAPIIASSHKVHLLGHKLFVEGFPSMDQHIDISVCAHAACWSILRHYSERFSSHREYLTHDITLMAQHFDPGGLVPSKGLEISSAERVFQAAGTYPYLVAIRRDEDDEPVTDDPSFSRQLISYLESGFPLFAAMHGRGHAMALVGCEWATSPAWGAPGLRYAWQAVQKLIAVDDNYLPYLPVPIVSDANAKYSCLDIDSFIVPLPEKVFYPADAVDRLAPTIFKFDALVKLPAEDESIIRYFITTGSTFRNFVRERSSEFDPKLVELVMSLPFAQFVWIVEISTRDQWAAGQISARAVLDATASLRDPMPFWLIHNRANALAFERHNVGDPVNDMHGLTLHGMEHTALTKMTQNMRRTSPR